MVETYDLRYPVCRECGEGVLLPFFWKDGRNVYFCSNCGVKFTGLKKEPVDEGEPVFLDRAIYMGVQQEKAEMGETEVPSDDEEEDIDEMFEIPDITPEDSGAGDEGESEITAQDILEEEEVEFRVEEVSTAEDEGPVDEESVETEKTETEEEKMETEEKEEEVEETVEDNGEMEEIPKDEKAYEEYLAKYIEKEEE